MGIVIYRDFTRTRLQARRGETYGQAARRLLKPLDKRAAGKVGNEGMETTLPAGSHAREDCAGKW